MDIRNVAFRFRALLLCSLLIGVDVYGSRVTKILPLGRRLFVDACSASIPFGRVSLVVSPLRYTGKTCVGSYRLKVFPYFLKNEKGTLVLDASDGLMKTLMSGSPVGLAGKATSNKNGKVKAIVGKAIPETNQKGKVTFSINSEFGLIVFNTTYHFGD
ncbi:MAG: hypothetical protein WCL08_05280 [Verrucomicrobiota bacterium]